MTRCLGTGDFPNCHWCSFALWFLRCEFDATAEVCAAAPRPAACEWLFESCWEVTR